MSLILYEIHPFLRRSWSRFSKNTEVGGERRKRRTTVTKKLPLAPRRGREEPFRPRLSAKRGGMERKMEGKGRVDRGNATQHKHRWMGGVFIYIALLRNV